MISSQEGRAHNAKGAIVLEDLAKPNCPTCKGLGLYKVSVELNTYDRCACVLEALKKRRSERMLQDAGMSQDLTAMTFESFQVACTAQRNFLSRTQAWIEQPLGTLIFCGSNGCGKTHLARAALNTWLASGRSGGLINLPYFFGRVRASYAQEETPDLMALTANAELLVIDELGTEYHGRTDWAKAAVYELINFRYSADLPTIITTNLGSRNGKADRGTLEKDLNRLYSLEYSNAITSRLLDRGKTEILFFNSIPDYRLLGLTEASP
ncbi:ATP-binding protein [Leptolyngbya sp. FACHB-261]|uniref:ATP-binding protein n=1 Tax=Leptolyngbya sp. FACHB-261 TaxID=2692806 RepID=UPI001689BB79|nr:ATP-binding protein [Leptolyngbya sp. FACHB-261]MBD2099907.1 ATP-binding protein [Leptolyngbya sp. FACHB-261]